MTLGDLAPGTRFRFIRCAANYEWLRPVSFARTFTVVEVGAEFVTVVDAGGDPWCYLLTRPVVAIPTSATLGAWIK